MEVVNGIQKSKLEDFILDLNDDIDSISFMIEEINQIVYDSNDYFMGKVADTMRDKYEELKGLSKVMIKNLITYSDDLVGIKNGSLETDKHMATSFEDYASKANSANTIKE